MSKGKENMEKKADNVKACIALKAESGHCVPVHVSVQSLVSCIPSASSQEPAPSQEAGELSHARVIGGRLCACC